MAEWILGSIFRRATHTPRTRAAPGAHGPLGLVPAPHGQVPPSRCRRADLPPVCLATSYGFQTPYLLQKIPTKSHKAKLQVSVSYKFKQKPNSNLCTDPQAIIAVMGDTDLCTDLQRSVWPMVAVVGHKTRRPVTASPMVTATNSGFLTKYDPRAMTTKNNRENRTHSRKPLPTTKERSSLPA